ncbi:flagellar hook assembly protein FlgD [Candidatus Paracaedibacter symbiosus]|uniref:flagellar hook assembly protein FlgD n=1 Tax=Candidatus Paracaedibacter symbiosus TaxID=244582 RepID=UPI00050950FF|nr:hypothetical protein [Candidatus Paracaedibacter symbiosus]
MPVPASAKTALPPPGGAGKKVKEKSGMSKILDQTREEQMKVFEKIFLAQVQHPQDPLNPPSNESLTQNIMMFHSSAQQSRMNELLEQINTNHIKAQGIAAKSYLNKEVEYQGNEFSYEGGEENIAFLMPDNIKEAKLAIVDPTGAGVTSIPISVEPGAKIFKWDGSIHGRPEIKVPQGQYKAAVIAHTKDDNKVEVPLTFKGVVRKVGYHDASSEFALLVRNTPIEMSDVATVSKPASPELISMTEGVQEQIKRYNELSGYLKNRLDQKVEANQLKESVEKAKQVLEQVEEMIPLPTVS